MELPPDSLFQRIKEAFIFRQGRSQCEQALGISRGQLHSTLCPTAGAMAIDEYARKVVEVALKSSPSAHYWMGGLSFRTWCWHTFLPKVSWVRGSILIWSLYRHLTSCAQDYLMAYQFNLGKLRRIVQASHRTMI
jgi:hypothetical protein